MRVIKKCAVFNQTVSQTNFDLEFLLKYQWICLLNTIPLVSITYFYDYWFQNYKSKCQESQTFIAWIYHTGLSAIYGGYSSNFSSGRFILGPFMGGGLGRSPSSWRQRAAGENLRIGQVTLQIQSILRHRSLHMSNFKFTSSYTFLL